jgi:dTDP-4-amino-4,6-dideoxygalactose transaminase
MEYRIPFNKPFLVGRELDYIAQAVALGNLAGDGHFSQSCCRLLEQRLSIPRVMLTPSCTAALEMAAMLCDLKPGDEVILPSFTFVSTASAFVRVGARPVFVDIRPDTLNLDENLIEAAITERTRVIVPVHYAGVACEMDRILSIARAHRLFVVEDAAQGVNAFYRGKALGSIGDLGCYSFHETKNFISGEGGAICINRPDLVERAEILRDKGTDRQKFFRGQVDKYTWVDVGSAYVPCELIGAFLYGQLEMMQTISERRRQIYEDYQQSFEPLAAEGLVRLPHVPPECTTNFHLFYLLTRDAATQNGLLAHLNSRGIGAVFHYVPLHSSPMGRKLGCVSRELPVTDSASARLIRLPFYYTITSEEQAEVVREVTAYLRGVAAPAGRE